MSRLQSNRKSPGFCLMPGGFLFYAYLRGEDRYGEYHQPVHTCAQAIEDGVLIDVSMMAKEAGFTIPVAVTAAVWNEYIVASDALSASYGQSEDGWLRDTLYMLYAAIRRGGASSQLIEYDVIFLQPAHKKYGRPRHRIVRLKSECHPGDAMEPVITIMLPTED